MSIYNRTGIDTNIKEAGDSGRSGLRITVTDYDDIVVHHNEIEIICTEYIKFNQDITISIKETIRKDQYPFKTRTLNLIKQGEFDIELDIVTSSRKFQLDFSYNDKMKLEIGYLSLDERDISFVFPETIEDSYSLEMIEIEDKNIEDTDIEDTDMADKAIEDTDIEDKDIEDTDIEDTDIPDTAIEEVIAPKTKQTKQIDAPMSQSNIVYNSSFCLLTKDKEIGTLTTHNDMTECNSPSYDPPNNSRPDKSKCFKELKSNLPERMFPFKEALDFFKGHTHEKVFKSSLNNGYNRFSNCFSTLSDGKALPASLNISVLNYYNKEELELSNLFTDKLENNYENLTSNTKIENRLFDFKTCLSFWESKINKY